MPEAVIVIDIVGDNATDDKISILCGYWLVYIVVNNMIYVHG